ncbi:E3 ubiquitin-protein ligase Midline-1-like isoform X5 [Littorina saxatilis]|uniref:E3 ubiquitin-protein ligase Midline-1-like isoform X5 n=1 Tax=Littorina saxatilis TaxID=31220 RepID=UPI0038B4658F
MASAAIPFDGNDTECSVCHELFKNPKLLPCAHVLCRHCLLSWLASNPGALCPLCRGAIADPKEKSRTKGWEEVVDALPDDVAMAALVESTRVLSRDHVCAGCEDSGAVSICLHCGDMLCASCTRAHGNLSATRQHTVETLATMTAERLATNQFAACCVHSDKPSELYCPTHGAAICHLCASSEHRACPEVTLFEKRLNELQQELSAMSEMLKAAEGNLDKAISQLDQQLEEAERNANKSLAEIDEACDRLEKSIKACRRRLRELTLVAKEKVEESVQATRADMLSRRGRMTSHRRVVDRVKVTSPPGKLEKATTTVRLRVQGLNLRVTVPSSILSMKTIKVDNTTLARLEKELTFLGEERHISGALSEVQIDTRKGKSSDFFPCGVVKSHPDTLKIPKTALDGWADAVVFSSTVFQFGSEKDYNIDKRLRNLKEGTRVGFVRDAGGFLHLYIDGEKQWIYARNLPKDCYVFFELLHTYQKMTALPMTVTKKAL